MTRKAATGWRATRPLSDENIAGGRVSITVDTSISFLSW